MNIWIQVAAGILTGAAVIASLSGFSKKSSRQEETEIPDEILDGPLEREAATKPSGKQRERELRDKTEQGVRSFQECLSKLSNVIGNLALAVTSIMKVFYDEPYDRVTPSMIIC